MHYRELCLVANVCTKFFDDIAAGVKNFEMFLALQKTYKWLKESGSKFAKHNCDFGTTKINYLGSTITPEMNSP